MKKIILFLGLLFFSWKIFSVEIIPVSELHPGMKGYGLSVFKGYQPERFEVEIIDILPKALPKSDLILVKCSGAGLEKSRVSAGMSGSPIYFQGKLAGALAYTWSFSQEPIAGVTPIEAMLEFLKQPAGSSKARQTSTEQTSLSPQLKPVDCPIMVSGFAPGKFHQIKEMLEGLNLGPVISGGGETIDKSAPAKLEPGSAVGVELVRGDLNISAIGTATLVEGNTVLAFGHGFYRGGAVSFPLTLAKVHTIISSEYLSFKLASPAREIGELTRDLELGIAGRLNQKPQTIPVKIEVNNQILNLKNTYNFQVANHPAMVPVLVQICLFEAISSSGAVSEYTTVKLDLKMQIENYESPINYQDWFTFSGNIFTSNYLAPISLILNNRYQKVKIKNLDFKLKLSPGWEVATIKSVWANKTEVAPGDTVLVGIRFQVFQGEEFEKKISLKIPEKSQRQFTINLMGGETMPPDFAPPNSLEDLIQAIKKLPSPRWLVVRYSKPGLILDEQGKRLRGLPPSAQKIIAGKTNSRSRKIPAYEYQIYPMPYIIRGGASLRFKVKTPPATKKPSR